MMLVPPFLHSPKRPDADYIRGMFDAFAGRYDTFARLIGFGRTQALRAKALEGIRPGMRVLDLACGTGNMTFPAAERAGKNGRVLGLDFSPKMIETAHRKWESAGLPGSRVRFVVGRAEDLPLEDEPPFDVVISGFAIRNLYEHIGPVLDGVRRSLKPGGRIFFIDLTEPPGRFRRALYRGYLFGVVGFYGAALFGRRYPPAYLPDSASRFFDSRGFVRLLKEKGFTGIRARSFFLGAVTLYEAGV